MFDEEDSGSNSYILYQRFGFFCPYDSDTAITADVPSVDTSLSISLSNI